MITPSAYFHSVFLEGPGGLLSSLQNEAVSAFSTTLLFGEIQAVMGPLSHELAARDCYAGELEMAHQEFLGCMGRSGAHEALHRMATSLFHVSADPYTDAIRAVFAKPSGRVCVFPRQMKKSSAIDPLVLKAVEEKDQNRLHELLTQNPTFFFRTLCRLVPKDEKGAGYYLHLFIILENESFPSSLITTLIHAAEKSDYAAKALLHLGQVNRKLFALRHFASLAIAAMKNKRVEQVLDILINNDPELKRLLFHVHAPRRGSSSKP